MRSTFARQVVLALAVSLCWQLTPSCAHYPWLTLTPNKGEHGQVQFYFEEGPAPGDGRYLGPFIQGGQAWIRTPGKEPVALKMKEMKKAKKRWLVADLPTAAPRGIDLYAKFGVYRYPRKRDVLLHYYARCLDIKNVKQLKSLARSEKLALDVVPTRTEKQLSVQVLWQGKPAAGRPVYVRPPRGKRLRLTTDRDGRVDIPARWKGRYLFRTNVAENKAGKDGKKSYQEIRHHATLHLQMP